MRAQVALDVLVTEGRVQLQPLLGGGYQAVFADAALADVQSGAPLSPHASAHAAAVQLPWVRADGEEDAALLADLAWQAACVLAQHPGAPEPTVAAALGHALAAPHVRALLELLERRGAVSALRIARGVSAGGTAGAGCDGVAGVPDWLGGATAGGDAPLALCAARDGWRPALFLRGAEVAVAPVEAYWSASAGALARGALAAHAS